MKSKVYYELHFPQILYKAGRLYTEFGENEWSFSAAFSNTELKFLECNLVGSKKVSHLYLLVYLQNLIDYDFY